MRLFHLLIWGLCCVIAGTALIVYTGSAYSSGTGYPLLPLDDTYIHFQYARQIAAGQPYSYNPGLPPTSGATSLLYPYVLAVGYAIGFTDLNLALWALGIGAIALALTGFGIYRCLLGLRVPPLFAGAFGTLYPLSGFPQWHAFSGMETALITAAVIWTLDALIRHAERRAIVLACLCAMLRPEAAVIAGGTSLLLIARRWARPARPGRAGEWDRGGLALVGWLPLLLPVLAVGVQPLLNRLATGSAVASGSSAKSVFGIVPFELESAAARAVDQFSRILAENYVTSNSDGQLYLAALLYVGWVGLAILLWQRRTRGLGVTIGVWLIGMAALIATLDTAFWHFKRYHAPAFALMVVLTGYTIGQGLDWLFVRQRSGAKSRMDRAAEALSALSEGVVPVVLIGGVWTLAALLSAGDFVRDHALNVGYVAAQPYQMAVYLRDKTPPDAVIAVHDVGLMRYHGGRTTFDIVGLTTPGAAESWRSGPGAVGELIDRTRPTLIAAYGEGHGTGLGYLAATDLYADALAEYRVDWIDGRGVALAAPLQGIYQPRWERADAANVPHALPVLTDWLTDMTPIAVIDVADLAAEAAVGYTWDAPGLTGFATEWMQLPTVGCADGCVIMDGGRRLTGAESFTLPALSSPDGRDRLLITRARAAGGSVQIYVNDRLLGQRVIPDIPGYFIELPTLIPYAETDAPITVRIVPLPGTLYQPYHHWVYAGDRPAVPTAEPLVSYQGGSVALLDAGPDDQPEAVVITLDWRGQAVPPVDAVVFVHVVDASGTIAAQTDIRPGGGALPPGNWIDGAFRDTISVSMAGLPAGEYSVLIGLYDPATGDRWQPDGGRLAFDEDGRIWIGNTERR